jgi:hypothetical protein
MPKGSPRQFSSAAREEAHRILSQSQYQSRPQRAIDPLGGVIHAIGDGLSRVFGPLWRWLEHHPFHAVGSWFSLSFGSSWPAVVLAVAGLAGVAVGFILIRRRQRPDLQRETSGQQMTSDDPRRFEDLAQRAEASGDLEGAIRLRFRAGILRLERLGAVDRSGTRTNSEISRTLRSATFDTLAADLESIVYAGESATRDQADESRSGWPVLVSEVKAMSR